MKRSMDVFNAKGNLDKGNLVQVQYLLFDNGQVSYQDKCKRYLREGEILTLKSIDIGDFITNVTFRETGPNVEFNSVMFTDFRVI